MKRKEKLEEKEMSKSNSLQDRIPSDLSDQIEKTFADKMASDVLRKKVKEIFDECIDSVPFMDKVKGYSGREIDERIFKNGNAILFWSISVLVAGVVGAVIIKYIHP